MTSINCVPIAERGVRIVRGRRSQLQVFFPVNLIKNSCIVVATPPARVPV